MKNKTPGVKAKVVQDILGDQVNIEAGSVVIDNRWVSYNSTIFNVRDYIQSVLVPPRSSFFQNRSYAVYLHVGLNSKGDISVTEGPQVLFTSMEFVPPPSTISVVSLIGIILVQNGTRDLNFGLRPLTDSNIIKYSGFGNVLNKNLVGLEGPKSDVRGEDGVAGETGIAGEGGVRGPTGIIGLEGPTMLGSTGMRGSAGITGINWNIHYPLESFI